MSQFEQLSWRFEANIMKINKTRVGAAYANRAAVELYNC